MKAIYRKYLFGLMLSMAAVACDVHEFPVPEPEPVPEPVYKECMLKLVLEDDQYDFHDNVIVSQESSRSAITEHDLRYIVRAYRYENLSPYAKGSRTPSRTVIDYYTGTVEDEELRPDLDLELKLEPGEYDIVAWADHVEAGTTADLYHDTGDFMEIKLLGAKDPDYNHSGNEHHRVAWRGYVHILVDEHGQVSLYDNPEEIVENITMDMERPMARYHFITNDLNKFIENEMSRHGVQAQSPGMDAPGADAPGLGAPTAPNLNDYKVVVRYTGYMPCAYNLFTDKPMDSATGVSYEGQIRPIDATTAELSFDHVLVNHEATSAQVALELYRVSDGQKLSSTNVVNVPLKRGRYTTVTGPFLTTTAGTSMGIVADFDGEFNIEIR